MIEKVQKIADMVTYKCPIMRTLFGGIYRNTFTKFLIKYRNRKFRKNAINVLKQFDECMNKNNYPYCLIFGSLLGAVREKGFIKHDLDLDTAMWIDDYTPQIKEELKKCGFKLEHEFVVEDGKLGREETYEKDGVSIDIFYFYDAIDEYPYCCSFDALPSFPNMDISMKKQGKVLASRVIIPFNRNNYVRLPFESLVLPCPDNADEILRYRYGNDYMVPKPKWNPRTDDTKHVIQWPEVTAKYYH